jgi:hypothetical protein
VELHCTAQHQVGLEKVKVVTFMCLLNGWGSEGLWGEVLGFLTVHMLAERLGQL